MESIGFKCRLALCAFGVCLFVFSLSVGGQAVPGVTEKEILNGSCSALEGPSHFLGTETGDRREILL